MTRKGGDTQPTTHDQVPGTVRLPETTRSREHKPGGPEQHIGATTATPTTDKRRYPQEQDDMEVLTTEEAARLLHVKEGTLRYWRANSQGPCWFRLGPRKIAYLRSDLETWLRDQFNASYVNPEKP